MARQTGFKIPSGTAAKAAVTEVKRAIDLLGKHDPRNSNGAAPALLSSANLKTLPLLTALCREARNVRRHSQAPYSRFRVGAALLCEDGTIVSGVNVESASYGLTICAERSALVSALSQGHRNFLALAVDASTEQPICPCGACRQLLVEYCPDIPLLLMAKRFPYALSTPTLLLPAAFRPQVLMKPVRPKSKAVKGRS